MFEKGVRRCLVLFIVLRIIMVYTKIVKPAYCIFKPEVRQTIYIKRLPTNVVFVKDLYCMRQLIY